MRKLIGADVQLSGEDAQLDPRRFRPNIVVETEAGIEGFIEDDWLQGTLEIGSDAGQTVTIVQLQDALRCVMTTHQQAGLSREMQILRTSVQQHKKQGRCVLLLLERLAGSELAIGLYSPNS